MNAVANNGDSGQIKVIETLATDYPQCTLAVYTPKVSRKTRLNLIDSLHNADYHLPAPSGFQGRLWRLFGITNCLQPDKIDIYHGLNGELPLNIAAAHVPTVVSITEADLQPLRKKGGWPRSHLKLYLLSESLRNATRIIADSDETKRILKEAYGIACEKINVITDRQPSASSLMTVYEAAIDTFNKLG